MSETSEAGKSSIPPKIPFVVLDGAMAELSPQEIAFRKEGVRKILESFRAWQEEGRIYCSVSGYESSCDGGNVYKTISCDVKGADGRLYGITGIGENEQEAELDIIRQISGRVIMVTKLGNSREIQCPDFSDK